MVLFRGYLQIFAVLIFAHEVALEGEFICSLFLEEEKQQLERIKSTGLTQLIRNDSAANFPSN